VRTFPKVLIFVSALGFLAAVADRRGDLHHNGQVKYMLFWIAMFIFGLAVHQIAGKKNG